MNPAPRRIVIYFLTSILILSFSDSYGQKEIITDDVAKDKPQQFQSKTLKSEKTGDKKFTIPRKIVQNTVTHYNYYFNANNKLERVIDRAKIAQKENYLKLLPFYPYSLNSTSSQRTELDSVIYKATAGILLHDLRNNWVDDLYLLIGEAYYLRRDFDSAAMTFQFINYNLAPKKKYDDQATLVGSNDNENTSGFLSIANKEKKGFTIIKKPARNDALLWQARTLISSGEYPEAAGLMNTLQNDPNFPSRLHKELEELYGYLYYEQEVFDSAAVHLEKSFNSQETKQDRARKEFLIGQLYELSKEPLKASDYYSRAANHTADPLMDIYANLFNAKILKGKVKNELENNIESLLRLAKKGKFENYRDIVFYSAGELELQKPDTALAEKYFKKSISVNINNAAFKNKAFLQLANLEFSNKHYKNAAMNYDSLDINDASMINDVKLIQERKKALSGLVKYMNIIERQDSLQLLAKMTPAAREEFIKKLLKKLRKENGLKEDANYNSPSNAFNKNNNSSNIFGTAPIAGDWYFYNPTIKSRGYSEFKSKWGKRENVDNWRRQSSSSQSNKKIIANPDNVADVSIVDNGINPSNVDLLKGLNPLIPQDLSYDGMLANVPITDDKLKLSNSSLSTALFLLGDLYENSLEEYGLTIQSLERSLSLNPDSLYGGLLYSDLYYAYEKMGNKAKADYYKNLLTNKFQKSKYAASALHPKVIKPGLQNPAATASYEKIYNSFIEGDFIQAVDDKKIADSIYGNTYWNPQLLYIEAVYHVKIREDSQAIVLLNNIGTLYPNSPLKAKADNLANIVKRRKEIENYLTNLKVERANDSTSSENSSNTLSQPQVSVPNQVTSNTQDKKNDVIRKSDNISSVPVKTPPASAPSSYTFKAEAPQNVVMILDKVDGVYVSEAKNAFNRYNRERNAGLNVVIGKDEVDKEKTLLLFTPFLNAEAALNYMSLLKIAAPSEVSWLPAFKYSFIIISDENLAILKSNKNIEAYKELLRTLYPGKF